MFEFIERFKTWSDSLDIDFVRWMKPFGAVSMLLIVLSWAAFFAIGPNWGTDFTGGTEMHLKFSDPVEIGELREGLRQLGLDDDAVQQINGADSGEFVVRIADPRFGMEGLTEQVEAELEELYGADWVTTIDGTAEVSARFVVNHQPPAKPAAEVTRDLQAAFPLASARLGKEENQVVVDVPGL